MLYYFVALLLILVPSFDAAAETRLKDLHSISIGSTLVYIDHTGEIKISLPDGVSTAYEFREGLAKILTDKHTHSGFINKTGKIVFYAPKRSSLGRYFSDGTVTFYGPKGCGYLNKTGKPLISNTYERCEEFSEGLAAVYIKKSCGYINKNGIFQIPLKYDSCSKFFENHAAVSLGDSNSVITRKGTITEISWKEHFSRQSKNSRKGLTSLFERTLYFYNGLVAVRMNNKWGYIDKKGKVIIAPQFINAGYFSNGLAPVQIERKWGYIDRTGKIKISPRFAFAHTFVNGRAKVYGLPNHKPYEIDSGYINSDGEIQERS